MHFAFLLTLTLVLSAVAERSGLAQQQTRWERGLPTNEKFFPIAVWLQDPKNAIRYRDAGINLYVALWRGATSNQLALLQQAGISVVCSQSRGGLVLKEHPSIVGWMHGDEPDNAQSLGKGKGYGPPVSPEKIVQDYERLRTADPTRPVLLNLGQGVAWDNWIGRGVRRNHPEDYPAYIRGSDIVSFDIYPAVHENAEVAGKLEFVARGVERLRRWSDGERIVWNCIECTHIDNPQRKPTPDEVRAEVWMSLIHGSRGLIYFVHQFKPTFNEAALLDDPEMLSAVTKINRRIHELAPWLNSGSVTNGVAVQSAGDTPIAWMAKRRGENASLFAVNMRDRPTRGTFQVAGLNDKPGSKREAVVLDENRTVSVPNDQFSDEFKPYEVHLYQLK